MKNYIYPAIFTLEEDGLYSIVFPDFEACFTQGKDIEDGLEMAKDVLSLVLCDMEDDGKDIPLSSVPQSIKCDKNSFVTLISVNTAEYRKLYSGKAVKKTLSIPMWLNTAAERENINFSQTLQNALIEKLSI